MSDMFLVFVGTRVAALWIRCSGLIDLLSGAVNLVKKLISVVPAAMWEKKMLAFSNYKKLYKLFKHESYVLMSQVISWLMDWYVSETTIFALPAYFEFKGDILCKNHFICLRAYMFVSVQKLLKKQNNPGNCLGVARV